MQQWQVFLSYKNAVGIYLTKHLWIKDDQRWEKKKWNLDGESPALKRSIWVSGRSETYWQLDCATVQTVRKEGTEWGHPPVSLSLSTKQSVLKFV